MATVADGGFRAASDDAALLGELEVVGRIADSSNLSVLGRYVLPPSIFDVLERTQPGKGGEIQLTDALDVLAQQGALYGLETEGRLYDAGDRLGYIEATVAYALKRPELAKELRPVLQRLLAS